MVVACCEASLILKSSEIVFNLVFLPIFPLVMREWIFSALARLCAGLNFPFEFLSDTSQHLAYGRPPYAWRSKIEGKCNGVV